MFKKGLSLILGILVILFSFFLFSKPASAQFSGDLGSMSGSVRWGSEIPSQMIVDVYIRGNTTGWSVPLSGATFNTGLVLPADTYTVSASIRDNSSRYRINVGTQTVTVAEGQAVTNVDFDASTVSGLVKGNLTVNGTLSNGEARFCSPVVTDPCPSNEPEFSFSSSGFNIPILPGDYRLLVRKGSVSMGILPISVSAGEVIGLAATSVSVPTGQNVTVSLAGITVTFSEVTIGGFMTVTTTTHPQGGQPPSQYRFLGTYYELTTTATYSGPVTVSFTYNDADVRGREENLKLFHWDGTNWQNITTSVDTVNNIITGVTPTLSPFTIGEPLNTSPTVDAAGPYQVNEGGSVWVSATGNDPENGPLTYAWDLDDNGSFETTGQSVTFAAPTLDGPSVETVNVQVTDEGNLSSTDQAVVNVNNLAPTATFTATSPLDEGGASSLSLTNPSDDGSADTTAGFHYSIACNGQDSSLASSYATAGTENTVNCSFADNGNYTVKGRVFDKDDGFTSYEAVVVVNNVAPTVDAITALVEPVQANTVINTSANFTDVGTPDTHTAVWDWGDATTSAGTVIETNGSGGATGSHTYTTPGVYIVKLTVVDDDGGFGESLFQFVVVYDPEGGFVTGGGWVDSPSGAYTSDPSLTGKASFGFVSKYQNGATVPTGQTEFQFKIADFNFHSTSYDWLVVAGRNAKYKGSGTINGSGDYAFMLTAIDGQVNGGGNIDRFRIKIWDKNTNAVIYDNQLGALDDADAALTIGGGSIVIHQ